MVWRASQLEGGRWFEPGFRYPFFPGRLHRIPRTYPRFWAGLRALKLPIYPFFGPAYRPRPPRFIRTAGRPLCVYSGVLASRPSCRELRHSKHAQKCSRYTHEYLCRAIYSPDLCLMLYAILFQRTLYFRAHGNFCRKLTS